MIEENMAYIQYGVLCTKEIISFLGKWIEFKIMLSKISQIKKD
jgi:hypothetical protein